MPFAALTGVGFATAAVDPALGGAAMSIALVPAPLVAPGIIGRMRGGRMDLAGALVLGTVLVSLLFIGGRGDLAVGGLFVAVQAYAISAMFANALPTVRDRLLTPLRIIGWAAFAFVLLSAGLVQPRITPGAVIVAVALVVAGAIAASLVAFATDRDLPAAVGGAGLRDPALAVALLSITAGPDATGVALVYAVFCLGLAGIALRFT